MAELGLVDYFVIGEAVGIVATLLVSFYFLRKQMQKLSVDIETKVLSDLSLESYMNQGSLELDNYNMR
jgi:cell division protein FtsL